MCVSECVWYSCRAKKTVTKKIIIIILTTTKAKENKRLSLRYLFYCYCCCHCCTILFLLTDCELESFELVMSIITIALPWHRANFHQFFSRSHVIINVGNYRNWNKFRWWWILISVCASYLSWIIRHLHHIDTHTLTHRSIDRIQWTIARIYVDTVQPELFTW